MLLYQTLNVCACIGEGVSVCTYVYICVCKSLNKMVFKVLSALKSSKWISPSGCSSWKAEVSCLRRKPCCRLSTALGLPFVSSQSQILEHSRSLHYPKNRTSISLIIQFYLVDENKRAHTSEWGWKRCRWPCAFPRYSFIFPSLAGPNFSAHRAFSALGTIANTFQDSNFLTCFLIMFYHWKLQMKDLLVIFYHHNSFPNIANDFNSKGSFCIVEVTLL